MLRGLEVLGGRRFHDGCSMLEDAVDEAERESSRQPETKDVRNERKTNLSLGVRPEVLVRSTRLQAGPPAQEPNYLALPPNQ